MAGICNPGIGHRRLIAHDRLDLRDRGVGQLMPESRLARTRELYEEPELPETRCICGAGLNEPHAPECYRHPHNAEVAEHGYGMGI